MDRRRIVITGIGVIAAIGNDRNSFWNGVLEARSGAGPIPPTFQSALRMSDISSFVHSVEYPDSPLSSSR